MDEMALQGLATLAMAGDTQSQSQAIQYIEQLKQSNDGWRFCAEAFTKNSSNNDHLQFFCLQVCEHFIKTRYAVCAEGDVMVMKAFLTASLKKESCGSSQSKSFIKNKLAQIMSLAFVQDYPERWPQFFADVMATLQSGESAAVDMYLRILMAIDSEVVDRDVAHTQEESRRNILIKDAIREQCVNQLAESWYSIMTQFEASDAGVVCHCLEVVGRYVSWMDIGFFANDRMVSTLLRFLTAEALREAACDCVLDIINKGMEPAAKTALIESFMGVLDSAGIFNCNDEDTEFLCKLSKLINGMGLSLIAGLQKLSKEGDANSQEATISALEAKIPYMLRFLGDEDDDVSGAVTDFASEYIAVMKTMPSLQERQTHQIDNLLAVIIKKLKYDPSYNFEKEGEDEAEFQEYRKNVRVIFNNIASLDSQKILVGVHGLVFKTLPMWKSLDFRDVEVAITLLYSLGEAIPASHGLHFSGNPEKASALQEMMTVLITSQVNRQGHQSVLLQFFETVVRYDKFFACQPQYIPEVLMAFLDERGLRNDSAKVRSRVAYLFSRFIKSTKSNLTPYLEEVLNQMKDLLVVNSPDNGISHSLSDSDQLFIYETASTLLVASTIDTQRKQVLMKQLLMPIATKFNVMLNKLRQEQDEQKQQAYAECIENAMSLASRASKGFSGQQTMKQCGCQSAFTELLSVFLAALEATNQRASLQQGVRQYLHRMVVCLEGEIMPFLPEAMERLLKQPDARELYDFLPLVNQIIMKFKAEIVPFLSQVFMPLIMTIYRVLNVPSDQNDRCSAEEKKLLQRGYFLFLATIVSNCLDVLKAQEMQNVTQVLKSIIHGAVEIPDPQSQRSCFVILKKLVEAWGGKDTVPGFMEIVYTDIVPACFMAPMKPTFDFNDGQATLALGDCAVCLHEIYQQRRDEFVGFLKTDFFPNRGMSPADADVFVSNLQAETKVFKPWLRKFFQQAKS